METYCPNAGIAVDEWIEEIGGGMNFKRKKFLALVDRIQHGEVERLIVAHKDRLVRFGFDLIAHIAEESGSEIVVVNQLEGPLNLVHFVCEKTTFILRVSALCCFGPEVVLARCVLGVCLT